MGEVPGLATSYGLLAKIPAVPLRVFDAYNSDRAILIKFTILDE